MPDLEIKGPQKRSPFKCEIDSQESHETNSQNVCFWMNLAANISHFSFSDWKFYRWTLYYYPLCEMNRLDSRVRYYYVSGRILCNDDTSYWKLLQSLLRSDYFLRREYLNTGRIICLLSKGAGDFLERNFLNWCIRRWRLIAKWPNCFPIWFLMTFLCEYNYKW